jgi:hypothetical protein
MNPNNQPLGLPPQRPEMLTQNQPPTEPTNPHRYEKYKAQQELVQAVGSAHEILCHAKSVFPFMLFPDEITVDREQVSITHRQFFKMGEVNSIRIADILNVEANIGPFFGSLQISTRFFTSEKQPYQMKWLSRDEALRVKRILHGYLVAIKKNIDVSALTTEELAAMLDQLGQGEAEATT